MTLRVTFLGTSGAVPTAQRNPSAIHVNREGEELLFDCGEGTQRQMMRFRTGFSISAIFLTHVHGDHVLGLPGLLQTLDFNDRAEPLAIHTPRGTRHTVEDLVGALDTRLGYPVEVREVAPGEVVHKREEYEIRAFRTEHRTRSVGYALVEADRKGRFDRERAEALGVPVGPKFSALHSGESVELDDGTVIDPEQVVGPPRSGRKVVYTGDTRPSEAVREVADRADLLIHDATFGDDWAGRARETGHATAREAGELAAGAGVKRLALTHVSSRYAGDASRLAREAREECEGAFVAEDGMEIEVSFPD
ncbi:ribonuclease Z [Halalkalicoccus sp. NIPERK01]|uniref:ribonuclease Z n=1 Tax=Halalkalicoccus sp. NIPERK01 TaxID=3053469 RepID=UPI00256EF2F8|nr:ribonuclease Z [Halalkalicoccus sp. NIPERK01]MDL5362221.1 ribonuclease Z [Halalkalicoccus sp. NIPERK01]